MLGALQLRIHLHLGSSKQFYEQRSPIRVIQGTNAKTLGTAQGGNDKVGIDADNNEILLPNGPGTSWLRARIARTPQACSLSVPLSHTGSCGKSTPFPF